MQKCQKSRFQTGFENAQQPKAVHDIQHGSLVAEYSCIWNKCVKGFNQCA